MTQNRLVPEVSAGSMADIAFLLLIFFLVTTTINSDKGLTVKLPIIPTEPIPPSEVNQRNVLNILINNKNALMVNNEPVELKDLKEQTKTFITNPKNEKDKPANPQKAIISLKNDDGTSYQTYLTVHNEVKAVYNQLWNESALNKYSKKYEQLNNEQREIIKSVFPYKISEAEPDDLEEIK